MPFRRRAARSGGGLLVQEAGYLSAAGLQAAYGASLLRQEQPDDVHAAYESLLTAGFTSRLIAS
ncbi:hypothetical protein CP975_21935 [Streptomyces alboniger]|uniref:Uncharacterized protein n=1 Tax=Streptomyces alboniger TaxID=132473 RepID=A0A5J6HST7_STRAD|nr:hypothetical protein CP975_21935 [Streptomyces alboniger]